MFINIKKIFCSHVYCIMTNADHFNAFSYLIADMQNRFFYLVLFLAFDNQKSLYNKTLHAFMCSIIYSQLIMQI